MEEQGEEEVSTANRELCLIVSQYQIGVTGISIRWGQRGGESAVCYSPKWPSQPST